MPRRMKGVPPIEEDLRITIDIALRRFRENDEETELEFPSSLTSTERAYIHRLIATYGLASKSKGKGASRFLTIYKKDSSSLIKSESFLKLTEKSKKVINSTMIQYPVTNKEKQELSPKNPGDYTSYVLNEGRDMSRAMGKLNEGIPQVPPAASCDVNGVEQRQRLPIWLFRSNICQGINENQVTIVSGETGSGKTTQVPQFILEFAFESKYPCRIVCTNPRRLAAVAMADRIATERGEKVGQTVGYQIRLESRVSPRTLLTFCTNGVLLRTLMGSGPYASVLDEQSEISKAHRTPCSLSSITHIIIDEVHERDRFSDFLLTVLRDALTSYPSLKLILMSATIDVRKFTSYFVNTHHIHVPGKIYPVKQIFLEDVLLLTKYVNPKIKKVKKDECINSIDNDLPMKMCQDLLLDNPASTLPVIQGSDSSYNIGENMKIPMDEDIIVEPDEESKIKADALLMDMFMNNADTSFEEFISLITSDESSILIDYKHSGTGATVLMCAAVHGRIDIIEHLLAIGADPSLKADNGWTAHDFAICNENDIAAEIIISYKNSLTSIVVDGQSDEIKSSITDMDLVTKTYEDLNLGVSSKRPRRSTANIVIANKGERGLSQEQEEALKLYHKSFDDDSEKGVDKNLIISIIKLIMAEDKSMSRNDYMGSILVFLPGYEDIIGLNNLLREDSSILVLMLHSQMISLDQQKVFRPPPKGLTKVILATNIAETSITINDVRYVIDTGKVKEKSYDSLSGATMLKVAWISQDSAIQRMGRAGRTQPGTCYRLFSSARYNNMLKSSIPEILRTPLTELCLATKLLAPIDAPIADFLARAPDPPSFTATRAAVQELKQMEAIDLWEGVTELGSHLLDLPIEPRLGKMVLYSVVLKCLDPILTIVCCVSYKDPFILSPNPTLRAAAKSAREAFSGGAISDHMALLRVFQGWQKARVDGNETHFCYKHQVATSTMDMITGMRTQLLGQLRASGFVRAKGYGDIRDLNKNSENWAVVKAALVGGAYPNLARYDRESKLLRTPKESKARLHPHSVLLNSFESSKNKSFATSSGNNRTSLGAITTDWFLFDEMSRAGRLALIRGVTAVSPVTVAIFAGPIRGVIEDNLTGTSLPTESVLEDSGSEDECTMMEANYVPLNIDEMITFRAEKDIAMILLQIRRKWGALFLRRLQCAGKPMTQVDECIINTLVTVLNTEETILDLNQPIGIGQRPKAIPPPESSNSNSRSFSPRKNSNKSKNFYDTSRYTSFKEKSTTSQSQGIPQHSIVTENEKMYDQRSALIMAGSGDMIEQIDSSTKYFVIKATNSFALEFSLRKGRWQFGNQTEHRLMKAIKSGYSVILVFSVQESSHFQGFASFSGRVSSDRYSELESQGHGRCSGTQYFIDWIRKGNVPFQATKHLLNLYNDKKKVQMSRDGQELDPTSGSNLCKMWERVPKCSENERHVGIHTTSNKGIEANKQGCQSKSSRRIVGRYQRS